MELVSVRSAVLTAGRRLASLGKTGGVSTRQEGMSTSHHIPAAQPAARSAPRPCSCGGGSPADVTWWRRCRLLDAGFPETLATVLAAAPAVDLHALLLLVDRGCPPELAARILSPLDRPA